MAPADPSVAALLEEQTSPRWPQLPRLGECEIPRQCIKLKIVHRCVIDEHQAPGIDAAPGDAAALEGNDRVAS
jgi:hypothetical protein